MPKNPHANFTPSLEGYTGLEPFRFWCQMALPLTYDDSLSYYELLCKVVNYLNNVITDVSAVEDNVGALANAYTQLQDYVNNYFDDLDIEEELRNVLDAMAEDGTLDALLSPILDEKLPVIVDEKIDDVVADQIDDVVADQIGDTVAEQLPGAIAGDVPDLVTDWLDENVEPVGSAVIVDSSLTITGAAADAKVTGDNIKALNNKVEQGETVANQVIYNKEDGSQAYSSYGFSDIKTQGYDIVINGTTTAPAVVKMRLSDTLACGISNPYPSAWLEDSTFTLKNGHQYIFKWEIISGTQIGNNPVLAVYNSAGDRVIYNDNTEVDSAVITGDGNKYLMFIQFSAGKGGTNLRIRVTVVDISERKKIEDDIDEINNEISEINSYIYKIPEYKQIALTKGRYLIGSERNPVGTEPVIDSTAGKHCIIDVNKIKNGGVLKLSIEEITSNETVATLITNEDNLIQQRYVTSHLMTFNADTNKYECSLEIPSDIVTVYFSIYGGSNSIDAVFIKPDMDTIQEDYYVSNVGNDENNSGTESSPLKTIKKAIELKAKRVYLLSDIFENIPISKDLAIIGNGFTIFGDAELNVEDYNSIKRAEYSADSRITECYINKTRPLTENAEGSSWKGNRYNIACYGDDIKLLPVDDIATCENTQNSFTWYNGYFYINSPNRERYSYVVYSYIIDISAGKVSLFDTKLKHSYYDCLRGINCCVEMNACVAACSVNGNCIGIEDGELKCNDCECYYSWNDGINTHGRGDSAIINCNCHDCSDDGVSQHDDVKGVVIGGEFCRCGKGGISSPINRAVVDIYNAYVHDNKGGGGGYGIYSSDGVGGGSSNVYFRVFGCVIVDNRIGLKINSNHALMYNNFFARNTANNIDTEDGGTAVDLTA